MKRLVKRGHTGEFGGSRLRQLLFIVGVLLSLASQSYAASVEDDVKAVFATYRSAILDGDGKKAAAQLSTATLKYYDDMRKLALTADANTLKRQSLTNQMTALLLRLRLKPADLESLSNQDLVASLVDEGMIGKNSVLRIKPGTVSSQGSIATLGVNVEGSASTAQLQFVKEAGGWRLNLVPTIQATNLALKAQMDKMNMSEAQFMSNVLESVIGKKVDDSVWVPLKAR